MRNKLSFLLLFFILSLKVSGQEKPVVDLDNFIQELFQQQDENINYEDVYESLLQYYYDPLDINKAGRDELNNLYILSPLQINNLLNYRQQNGVLLSLYELQVIPEFDGATIHKILPFITIKDPLSLSNQSLIKRMGTGDNAFLLLRYERTLELKDGFVKDSTGKSSYAGKPNKYYMRFKNSRSRDFSYGFTLEKDPGEKIEWSSARHTYGADFISWHLTLYNKGRIKAFSLGDYQLQFGQGLVLASGFNIGKGAETILTTKRNNLGIRPYTSAMESGYFHGAAVTYTIGRLYITKFYSSKNIDGTTNTLSDKIETFNSVNTGYHRTQNEISTKHAVNEKIFGTNIFFNNKKFHSGLTFVETRYDRILAKTDALYSQFEFSGSRNYNIGLDLNYSWQNFIFFGEAATSKNGGKAVVTGFLSSLSSKIELSMVYRNYEKNFQTFYGNAFGENTKIANEQGIYCGIKIKPFSQWTLSAYYDKFRFPWLKYLVDAPSEGYEYLARITYKPSKTVILYAQYREESKEKNQSDNHTNIDFIVPSFKRNYLLNLDFVSSQLLTLRTRIQFSNYRQSNGTTYGYAIMQDINLNLGKIKLSSHFALFETDDFDNRQYTYEKDVLYSFSLPSYYGRGIRMYLLAQMTLSPKIDIWLRIARTNYLDEKSISSGQETIKGSAKTDVKVQMRYSF